MPRNNRPVDFGPKSDIHRRDVVCWSSKTARLTSKIISSRSIGLGDMPARRTGSGSIPRIYQDHWNTGDLGFVVYEYLEKPEIPGMQVAMLCLSNRNSGSNSFKILKSNRSQSVFGLRNKLLGNAVISILGKSSHSTRKLLQMAFGRFSSFALEPGFQGIELVSGLIDSLARMYLSIRINGEILDTKIDTKNANWIIGRSFRDFDHNAKVENAFDKDQISLASDSVHPGFLVFSKTDRNKLSSLKGGNGDMLQALPGKDSLVIDDSSIWPKLWFDGLISLIGFSDLGNGSNRKLRGEAKSLSDRIVDCLVDLDFVGLVHRKSSFCNAIAGFIEAVHGIQEHLILFLSWIELNHQGLKHCTEENVQWIYSFQYLQRGTLLPWPKDRGIRYPCTPGDEPRYLILK